MLSVMKSSLSAVSACSAVKFVSRTLASLAWAGGEIVVAARQAVCYTRADNQRDLLLSRVAEGTAL